MAVRTMSTCSGRYLSPYLFSEQLSIPTIYLLLQDTFSWWQVHDWNVELWPTIHMATQIKTVEKKFATLLFSLFSLGIAEHMLTAVARVLNLDGLPVNKNWIVECFMYLKPMWWRCSSKQCGYYILFFFCYEVSLESYDNFPIMNKRNKTRHVNSGVMTGRTCSTYLHSVALLFNFGSLFRWECLCL